jgi:hypothetical protein
MSYFKKHWSAQLQEEVWKCIEEEVCSKALILFQKLIIHSSKSGGYD